MNEARDRIAAAALSGAAVTEARLASRDSIAFGLLLTAIGIFAVVSPMFSGVATTVLVGMLLIAAGIIEVVFAFQSETFGKGALRFVVGGLGIAAGAIILATPAQSLGMLTAVLAGFLVAGGIVDIVMGMKLEPDDEGRGALIFGGVLSLLFGVLVIAQWPVSGIWAVGLFIGFRMLARGFVLTTLGRAGQQALTLMQDSRIELLEQDAIDGVIALQETQAALAIHTATLLALAAEVQQKVSSSDVDPAIAELNQSLGEARTRMREAESKGRESWKKTQKEANQAFADLRKNMSGAAAELQRLMGSNSTD